MKLKKLLPNSDKRMLKKQIDNEGYVTFLKKAMVIIY
jgi:hypothetical protein